MSPGSRVSSPWPNYEWNWQTRIERDIVERALTLDLLNEARNLVLVGPNGLGKTMIAQNICHAAVLAGYSVLFCAAPALLEPTPPSDAGRTATKLRTCANVGLLCIDEVGYLSFDDKGRGPLVRSDQPSVRAQAVDRHHQQTLQRMERGPSQRHLHCHCAGPSAAPRRRDRHRGR
jgi:hypothetical protein